MAQEAGQPASKACRIRFLNHSCIVLESPATRILCDPWFEGTAFNDGWRLLVEHSHRIDAIDCDYIWLSHEHPDHFSIPTLRGLGAPRRFLYQKTRDGKVRAFLNAKGHTCTEMDEGVTYTFGDLRQTIYVSDGYDSAAVVEFPDGSVFLNANDARLEMGGNIERIRSRHPRIDVLAAQFSYANWAGNIGDEATPVHQQDLVIARLKTYIEAFQPKKLILFASFVHYAHEENFYWNRSWLPYVMNALRDYAGLIVIPRPDQVFGMQDMLSHDFAAENRESIAFWESAAAGIRVKDYTNRGVGLDDIHHAYHDFFVRIWSDNAIAAVMTDRNRDFSLVVYLPDLGRSVRLHLFQDRLDLLPDGETTPPDITVTAETLCFLLKNNFGRGTLTINGRIQFNYPSAHRFFIFFFVPYANNIGIHFREGRLDAGKLQSIARTSVMMSILKATPEARANFDRDLLAFG